MTNLGISAFNSIGKNIYAGKKSAKAAKSQLPNIFLKTKEGVTIMSAGMLASMLPASSFLDKTQSDESLSMGNKIYINGQWYEEHQPMDDSDYYHIIPCDPPEQPRYYPGS